MNSAGLILSHAIHIHDLARLICGPVAETSARLATRINPIETEDCAAILLRTASGALLTSSVTLGAASDMSRLRLVFEHVTVESGDLPYAPGMAEWQFLAREGRHQAEIDRIVQAVDRERPTGFAGLFSAIADALDGKPNDAPTLEDGIASIDLAAAIYRAHRTAAAVALPPGPGMPEYRRLAPETAP